MRIVCWSAFMGLLLIVWHWKKTTVVKNYLCDRAIVVLKFTYLCCFSMRDMDNRTTHLWAHTATPVDWFNRSCWVGAIPVQWASCRMRKMSFAHAPGMPGTFPHHPLERKPLFGNHSMHHGTYVTHVPWCMLGSLTSGGGENVPGIPSACTIRNFTYLVRGPWRNEKNSTHYFLSFPSIGSTVSLAKLITYRIMLPEGDW